MIRIRSSHDHATLVRRLIAAIEADGMKVFARIDHAAAAREVGLELADEELIIFGNPKAGTGLMQADPAVGIELPLRVLAWSDGDGTWLGYSDPRELAQGYALATQAATLAAMASLLADITARAAGDP